MNPSCCGVYLEEKATWCWAVSFRHWKTARLLEPSASLRTLSQLDPLPAVQPRPVSHQRQQESVVADRPTEDLHADCQELWKKITCEAERRNAVRRTESKLMSPMVLFRASWALRFGSVKSGNNYWNANVEKVLIHEYLGDFLPPQAPLWSEGCCVHLSLTSISSVWISRSVLSSLHWT